MSGSTDRSRTFSMVFAALAMACAVACAPSAVTTQSPAPDMVAAPPPPGSDAAGPTVGAAEYGYSEEAPILVGGGPAGEREYLRRLRGPRGEKVVFRRIGSCCPYPSQNALFGDTVPLDMYEVLHAGLDEPVVLYLNMYDRAERGPPKGFIFEGDEALTDI